MKKKEESRVRSGTPLGIRESLKKAVTEMLVLFVLQDRPMYTYEISQQLEKLSDKKITFNTLYPAIYRLQGFGYIAEHESITVDSRVRNYYACTPEGKVYLDSLIKEYQSFTSTIAEIMGWSNGRSGE